MQPSSPCLSPSLADARLPPDFDSAWRTVLRDLLQHGDWVDAPRAPSSPGSGFGQVERRLCEHLGAVVAFGDPRRRLPAPPVAPVAPFEGGDGTGARRTWNLPYALANVLWTLAGRNDLEMISAYNPRGRAFSDDGRVLRGAYGPRWIQDDPASSPLRQLLALLREDPATRRAVLPTFVATDLGVASRDVPCALGFQPLIRRGALHAVVYMRSQSAAMVMPYDTVLFTVLQELLAVELGLDLGAHRVLVGSLHVYEDELPRVRDLLAVPVPEGAASCPMPPMPSAPCSWLPQVMAWEARIRAHRADAQDLAGADLPEYWRGWLAVLGSAVGTPVASARAWPGVPRVLRPWLE